MQPLSAPPRDQLLPDQVRAVLTAADKQVGYGVELLDDALQLVQDITADVSECTVSHDATAVVHGSVALSTTRQLTEADYVRPFMLLSSSSAGLTNVRFDLGVHIPNSAPEANLGQTPISYLASGSDQLYLLQDYVGDSYAVTAGADVLTAIKTALTAAGIPAGRVLLDSTAAGQTVPTGGKTWPVGDGARWIDVVNSLLSMIGYVGLWVDWAGRFRSGPLVAADLRPAEWAFTVGDLDFGVIASDRSISSDSWGLPNVWTFYQNGLSAAPVEGTTQYTVDRSGAGRKRHARPEGLDAASYAALVVQGDAKVAAAERGLTTISTQLSKFPLLWHRDVATYTDPALGRTYRVQSRSWSLPLHNTDDMQVTWEVLDGDA